MLTVVRNERVVRLLVCVARQGGGVFSDVTQPLSVVSNQACGNVSSGKRAHYPRCRPCDVHLHIACMPHHIPKLTHPLPVVHAPHVFQGWQQE